MIKKVRRSINTLPYRFNELATEKSLGVIAEEARKRFSWSVEAAIVMAEALLPLQSANEQHSLSSSLSLLNVTPDFITALRNLKGLSNEFDIRIGLDAFMSDSIARRSILSQFAKEVFKYGEHSGQNASEGVKKSRTDLYR